MKNTRKIFLAMMVFSVIFISCQATKNKDKETTKPKSTIDLMQIPTAMSEQWKFIGEAVNEPGYDIWGSSPIRDDQGNVHLFCARWSSENPFITAWRFKSEIADWNNPTFTKGQRMSEQKLVTGFSHFLYKYHVLVPAELKQKFVKWAGQVVFLSENMENFRRFDREAGNIIAFPACALSVAMVMEEGKLKECLIELAYSHYDNFCGRNPQNAHCANHPELGFEGIEKGWPHGDPSQDVCARLGHVSGSLSSLPGSEMYPFNSKGRQRHGEGWSVYNANWNVGPAYPSFNEEISS